MFAVVPARDEAATLARVLAALQDLEGVVCVVNGSRDASAEVALGLGPPVEVVQFPQALGLDVPRAVGAARALSLGAKGVLFLDGDMAKLDRGLIQDLQAGLADGLDLALTDCYPQGLPHNPLAREVISFRLLLNSELGLTSAIAAATPSHGPSGVSRRLLESLGVKPLCQPPLPLTLAVRHGLRIGVAAKATGDADLGSKPRGARHARLIAETIIGDSLAAYWLARRGQANCRAWRGHTYYGYHGSRRFDLLEAYLAANAPPTNPCQ